MFRSGGGSLASWRDGVDAAGKEVGDDMLTT